MSEIVRIESLAPRSFDIRNVNDTPAVPCPSGHNQQTFSIGLMPFEGQTHEMRYAQWARAGGRNPWCGCWLKECPEGKP